MEESESALALAVHRGEPAAVERLVRRFQDGLFGFVLRLLGDGPDAQEVVQDAFVRAHRALTQQYDEARCRDLALRPWLFRIARNLAHNRRRAAARGAALPLPPGDGWHASELRVDAGADRASEAAEERGRLANLVDRLGPAARELVLLRFMEEMSYEEMAAVVGGTEASLRGKVFRALARLRSLMAEEEGTHAL